jgi:hypothetical protein
MEASLTDQIWSLWGSLEQEKICEDKNFPPSLQSDCTISPFEIGDPT